MERAHRAHKKKAWAFTFHGPSFVFHGAVDSYIILSIPRKSRQRASGLRNGLDDRLRAAGAAEFSPTSCPLLAYDLHACWERYFAHCIYAYTTSNPVFMSNPSRSPNAETNLHAKRFERLRFFYRPNASQDATMRYHTI